jgi:alkylation response protein AidB-like acyl-CoA dehydrogenase
VAWSSTGRARPPAARPAGDLKPVTMDFSFSAEQQELASSVRRFLASKASETELRRAMDSELGYDRPLWSRMANELGLQGLMIPEEYGGSGFTFLELGIVLQEMGRALLCAPFFSSVVLGALTLLECSDEAARRLWLPGIASGELIATRALTRHVDLRACQSGDGWTLAGIAEYVPDGELAELVLVPATTEHGPSMFAVVAPASGLERRRLETFDPTRRLARLEFSEVPARLVETMDELQLARLDDLAAIALASECVGVAERVLEMATDYAKLRMQFGRPIGSFQAIKHKLANVLLEVEAARSAAWYALWVSDARPAEIAVVAPLALATCAETAYLASAENIQVHGGIGCTWEHPAHLFFRRATTGRQLLGAPGELRETMLERLGF